MSSHFASWVSMVSVPLYSTLNWSFSAFFVVMRMTPWLARLPYRADAAGPFSTDIFSISSGLMLEMPSPRSNPPLVPALPKFVLSRGTPSITYRGWLFPVISVLPRRMTRVEPEGPPAVWLTTSPGTRPAIAFMKFVSLALVNSSPFTSATPYPSALRSRLMPRAVTTTSSSIWLSSSRMISAGTLPAVNSTVL